MRALPIILGLVLIVASTSAHAITVERLYQKTSYHFAVVLSDLPANGWVKCALKDGDGNYLRAQMSPVTGPVDEIYVGAKGAADRVESVECWTVDQ